MLRHVSDDVGYAQFRIDADRADIGHRTFWVKVDLEDFDAVAEHTWHVTSDGQRWYPSTVIYSPDRKRRATSMARLLLGDGILGNLGRVDYRNGNAMDNRRSNIRMVTQDVLLAKRKPVGGSSRYKGVTWDPHRRAWLAAFQGKKLGRFTDERIAARVFDDAAYERWGADAYLNFPKAPRGVPMSGAAARLLTFAVDQCLGAAEIQADDEAVKTLEAAKALVEHWTSAARAWIAPRPSGEA